ncbi:MAG: LacI family DNA-binding transcriptional regulator [Bacteroidota bacterium]|nr:LacI family DNA-binding transcriptional regulator [Bacteroidota bacterium]
MQTIAILFLIYANNVLLHKRMQSTIFEKYYKKVKQAAVTIKDIARELNISTATVSRALNNHPALSNETTQRVKDLAEKLGYQPNIVAFNLKKRKTKSIGIIVPNLAHHYFSNIISGAQEHLYKNGYNVLISQSNDNPKLEKEAIKNMISNGIDGLLISMSIDNHDLSYFHTIIEKGIPMVFFDRYDFSLESKVSSVTIDDFQGSYDATRALIESEARKIAFVGINSNINIGYNRMAGFRKAMQDFQLPIDSSLIFEINNTIADANEVAQKLILSKNSIDGVFCTTGLITLACNSEFRRQKSYHKHPRVAGFLNDLYEGYIENEVIRIISPTHLMGVTSSQLILDQILNDKVDVKKIVLPTQLIQD